jgi:hypothetical protein
MKTGSDSLKEMENPVSLFTEDNHSQLVILLNIDMKKLTKIMMVCGLMLGGVMFASLAHAQSEAAPAKEKAVSVSTVDAAPVSKKACTGMKKACCKSKTAAMGGNVTETSASAGNATSKKACTGEKKACCKSKASAMGGNVTETSASAGSTKAVSGKKACTGQKKACCKSKAMKMSSADTK